MEKEDENTESKELLAVRKELVELMHHPAASKETKEALEKIVKLLIKE